tara:strand:- start:271 stop:528 length:258 start_codon:yes stop_codon:yes gene_type:complete
MNRNYVIIDAEDVPSVNFSQVNETSAETLRWNIESDLGPAGTKTFVKFEGATPDFLEGKTQYTHAEMLAILATPEWTDPDGGPPA